MDWNSVAVQAVTALTPVVTLVAVWLLKLAWSKLPAAWIFVVTPIFGTMANFALSWLAGHAGDYSALVGAVLGLFAVVLREFITTLQAKGVSGAVTETKIMF